MHDIIQDLCIRVRDHDAALRMLAGARGDRAAEAARLVREREICERWLRVAGGEGALARMRAGRRAASR
ncbi:MAG: hypothetical protein K2Y51_26650 [Gammaproteobacteria bacterium]|jgi:hypothetical protein|nr:hypothetical protein [Gammaproteobacteria bacterium]